jgi:hypothetical protein
MQITLNQAAFCTVTILAVATGGAVIGAATTAATAAVVAYSILAVCLGGVSIASVTAWVATNDSTTDPKIYFSTMKSHTGVALAGMFQFVAQTLVMALVQGLANGITRSIDRRFA